MSAPSPSLRLYRGPLLERCQREMRPRWPWLEVLAVVVGALGAAWVAVALAAILTL